MDCKYAYTGRCIHCGCGENFEEGGEIRELDENLLWDDFYEE